MLHTASLQQAVTPATLQLQGNLGTAPHCVSSHFGCPITVDAQPKFLTKAEREALALQRLQEQRAGVQRPELLSNGSGSAAARERELEARRREDERRQRDEERRYVT